MNLPNKTDFWTKGPGEIFFDVDAYAKAIWEARGKEEEAKNCMNCGDEHCKIRYYAKPGYIRGNGVKCNLHQATVNKDVTP